MGQGKKILKHNVVPTFEDLKKPVAESKRKPPCSKKTIVWGNWGAFTETNDKKTQEVSEAFCINCHNYKEEIDKLLKQKQSSKFPLTNWKKW